MLITCMQFALLFPEKLCSIFAGKNRDFTFSFSAANSGHHSLSLANSLKRTIFTGIGISGLPEGDRTVK